MIPHPAPLSGASYSAIELSPDGARALWLDQRRLPQEERYIESSDPAEVAEAISSLAIRGAPAIGIAGAYGMVLAAHRAPENPEDFRSKMEEARRMLECTRPTAVNLRWGLSRMHAIAEMVAHESPPERFTKLAEAALKIHRDDVAACRRMGQLGAEFVPNGATILTHCNAGALATGGYGTALGVIRAAVESGKTLRVLVDETRPVLQGARLTAWELMRDRIEVTLISDNMAATCMRRGMVDLVVVGADRIARNGDVANKIGTYGVACLAQTHGIPFYVAAPWSTVDVACATGAEIPIEERSPEEVRTFPAGGQLLPSAPGGVRVFNPAFDVTDARLVRALFTERGVIEGPTESKIVAMDGQ